MIIPNISQYPVRDMYPKFCFYKDNESFEWLARGVLIQQFLLLRL